MASSSCPTYNDVFLSPECSSVVDGLAAVIGHASCSPLYQGMEESVGVPGNCHSKRLYNSMFEEEPGEEEMSDEVTAAHQVEKKRRLSVEQVKALEKNFEIENKLEPERKIQLARELGLQPRQVAVWFQNRRARWKTKQLEKDYELLKSELDDLKNSFMDLSKEKDSLQAEVARLRERLADPGTRENKDSATKLIKTEDTSVLVEGYTPSAANYTKVDVSRDHGLKTLNSPRVGPVQGLASQLGNLDQSEFVACKKEGSLSSDSDASEVAEVESPRRPRLFDSQDHSPLPDVNQHHMLTTTTSFPPQQVSAFMLHEDVSYVCRGLFPGSFEAPRPLLLKAEDDDHQLQHHGHHHHHHQQQQLLEDQQAPPFTWSWDPWA